MGHEDNLDRTTLTSSLRVITLCTNQLAGVTKLMSKVFKLQKTGPFSLDTEALLKLKAVWGISEIEEFEYYLFTNVEDGVKIRVLSINEEIPAIHDSHNHRNVGVQSIVFHSPKWEKIVTKINEKGHRKVNGFKHITEEKSSAIHTRILGSAQLFFELVSDTQNFIKVEIASDSVDEELKFYGTIFGYQSLEYSNLEFNEVSIMYHNVKALATDKTHIGFIEFEDNYYQEVSEPPRLPYEGVGMLTFETKDIGEVLARCHAHQAKVYQTPRKVIDPCYGEAITMSILSPTGIVIEVYNKL